MECGLIHIYCGDGKGKTTACIGLSVRCAGYDNKILFVQFLKSRSTGELKSLKLFANIEVMRGKETSKFTFQMTDAEKNEVLREHELLFDKVLEKIAKEDIKLLVLDEIIGACNTKVFDEKRLIEFLESKPQKLEVALSGRNPSKKLIELADYVSEICKRKHPMDQGVPARVGIEK